MNISTHLNHSLRIVHCAFCIALLIAGSANADPSISNVSARQRWPWNSLVDVDFTIDGAPAGEAYRIGVTATYGNGANIAIAKTFATEPIAKNGANRVVWDFGADYPDTKVDDLLVTVTATPFSDTTPLYLVVDISGGKDATAWPVRYTTTPPVHTPGVEDPCKTTELWLKRVKAGTIKMGGDSNTSSYASHTCILTEDYYLGVFEITQAQAYNMTGSYYSKFTNATYRATRPADSLKPADLSSPYFDSSNPSKPTGGMMKRLSDRTGLAFNLPTEWQWEYACRAGTVGNSLYPNCEFRYSDNSQPPDDYEWKSEQGMWSADYGTSYVDAYAPNPWGFYGMIGNVTERCLNKKQTIASGDVLTDPMGNSGTDRNRAVKGGGWDQSATWFCKITWRDNPDPWNGSAWQWKFGGRPCLTIKKVAE